MNRKPLLFRLLLVVLWAPCTAAFSAPPPKQVELGPVVYRAQASPFKPYVERLHSPSGVNVVLDSSPDHKHHHALMFGLTAGGVDFWGEDNDRCGREIPADTEKFTGPGWQTVSQTINWTSGENDVLLKELREVRVYDSKGPTLLTWHTTLTTRKDKVVLTGAHYVGLGIRLAPDFDRTCQFVFPSSRESQLVRGDERLTYGEWCAVEGEVGGKPVTVVMMEHPLDPRSMTRWFTMKEHFAYLAATLNIQHYPRPVTPTSPLDVTYGVAVYDGHPGKQEINATYHHWLSLNDPLQGRVNVALLTRGATATASSTYGAGYEAWHVIDGRWESRKTDKWNSAAYLAPHYVRIDLGRVVPVDRIVVRHEGAVPAEGGPAYNTADFRVQGSNRPWGPWIDLVPPIYGNTDNVTIHAFAGKPIRYVRVISETSEQNGGNQYGRIAEVQVYRSLEPEGKQ